MSKYLFLFLIGCFLACTPAKLTNTDQVNAVEKTTSTAVPKTIDTSTVNPIIGLATPIQLIKGTNTILLEDYFLDPSIIEEVETIASISHLLSTDKKTLTLKLEEKVDLLSEMTVNTSAGAFQFLLKAPLKKPMTLKLKNKNYKTVQVKGEMNSWNPNLSSFKLKDDVWRWSFELNPGFYQYIFVVDGKEMLDPENEVKRANGSGGFNSLIDIPKPDPKKVPVLWTKSNTAKGIRLGFKNTPTKVFCFWQNKKIPATIKADHILIFLPEEASTLDRSFVRAFSYNDVGTSNDILIPLNKGFVVNNANQLNRSDKEAQIMYFTLVDRFNNGNTAIDEPVDDDRIAPKANYFGGDLAGITAKIKDGYFKSLNINSIWLSPITQNPLTAYQEYPEPQYYYTGYHGYWPISSSKVDHRFGDDAALKELVETAHENGINILLDYVCNHVHEDHPLYKNNPEWATQLDLDDGRKNIRIWDEQRLTTWFDTFMPSLDLSNPEVIDKQVDSTMFWLKKFNLDGYRHDATKHVPLAFWRELTRRLKTEVMAKENRSIYQIGETYGSRELTQSYINSGMLDSQFDFNLYFDAREVFAKPETSMDLLYNSMMETFNYFGHHNTMGYITGNHDQPRVITYASGALDWSEDAKMAGFERDIQLKDPIGYHRLQMLIAYVMTIPGVPVIFYGDEIGMVGAGDPDNRRMMVFDGWNDAQSKNKQIVDQLTTLRKNNLSLTYGDTEILHIGKTTFAYSRRYFDQKALVVFNKNDQAQTISIDLPAGFEVANLKSNFDGEFSQIENRLEISLEPWSFEVLTN